MPTCSEDSDRDAQARNERDDAGLSDRTAGTGQSSDDAGGGESAEQREFLQRGGLDFTDSGEAPAHADEPATDVGQPGTQVGQPIGEMSTISTPSPFR